MHPAMIRFIEELSLNALPSQQTVYYDGWIVRFANGYTRRANSVNPLYPSTIPLEEKIEYCEALYGSKGQSTIFKLTSAVQPESLPEFLSRRGYIQDALTSVQTASLDDLPMPAITT